MSGTYVTINLNGEQIAERFYENNAKKQIKKSSELKKQLREKVINYKLNGKGVAILLTVALIKEI